LGRPSQSDGFNASETGEPVELGSGLQRDVALAGHQLGVALHELDDDVDSCIKVGEGRCVLGSSPVGVGDDSIDVVANRGGSLVEPLDVGGDSMLREPIARLVWKSVVWVEIRKRVEVTVAPTLMTPLVHADVALSREAFPVLAELLEESTESDCVRADIRWRRTATACDRP
jgi:hypothetical protein